VPGDPYFREKPGGFGKTRPEKWRILAEKELPNFSAIFPDMLPSPRRDIIRTEGAITEYMYTILIERAKYEKLVAELAAGRTASVLSNGASRTACVQD